MDCPWGLVLTVIPVSGLQAFVLLSHECNVLSTKRAVSQMVAGDQWCNKPNTGGLGGGEGGGSRPGTYMQKVVQENSLT